MSRRNSRDKRKNQQRAVIHRKKMRRRIILLVVEIILLAVLGAAAYAMSKLDKMDYQTVNEKNLEIYHDTGDYTNIALFGLDARDGTVGAGNLSDCIMIASIDNKTSEVKIISVYRDTLTQQQDGTYEKANAAYSFGGPEEAIALLNRNFDLDIRKYMSVNFNALADVIDLLGGVEIDLTDEEVYWCNGYCTETSKVVGRETTELTAPGLQTLDGIQAVSYARIRYAGNGTDFERTGRQRIVLNEIVKKAKSASLPTLNKIIDEVLPQVSTNLSTSDFVGLAASAAKYEIVEMAGFPFDVTTSSNIIGLFGDYVVPIGFADNVRQLHERLFGEADYQVSEKVLSIDSDVAYLSGISGSYDTDSGSSYEDESGYGDESGNTDEGTQW